MGKEDRRRHRLLKPEAPEGQPEETVRWKGRKTFFSCTLLSSWGGAGLVTRQINKRKAYQYKLNMFYMTQEPSEVNEDPTKRLNLNVLL